MKLIGQLKEKVEKAADLTEAKQEIANAGMELTDEEMEQISGGISTRFGHSEMRRSDNEINMMR